MRLVLDASVAVAATRPTEPSFEAARSRVERILTGHDQIDVPAIFSIEVASALVRVGEPEAAVRRYVDALVSVSFGVASVGPQRARKIRDLAILSKLRAADSTYVWLANKLNLPLCTLDREMATRGAAFCTFVKP
jgi:predicted nucleic acid-binding protein